MDKNIFLSLAKKFSDAGYRLYIVGGTSRDYLLNKEVLDYDFATDATPDDMRLIIPDAEFQFSKYGSVRTKINGVHVDITTLREEGEYKDSRHPLFIKYIKDIEKDYVRRDFTINAIYIDENFKIIDFCGGLKDLENKIIRFIGDPEKRIIEDPLRIARANRFKDTLGFTIEEKSLKAMQKYAYLLEKINPEKIKEEQRKAKK